jgi:hypothetical protein
VAVYRPRTRKANKVPDEFNVLALFKDKDRYIYVYDDDSRETLIACFRDQAADPDMNFTWFDAAVLTEKARQQGLANALERQHAPPSRISDVLPDDRFPEVSPDEGFERL